MDRQELEKLLKDIRDHFPDNYGYHFAKSINMQLTHMIVDENKKEILGVIEHLVDMIIEKTG